MSDTADAETMKVSEAAPAPPKDDGADSEVADQSQTARDDHSSNNGDAPVKRGCCFCWCSSARTGLMLWQTFLFFFFFSYSLSCHVFYSGRKKWSPKSIICTDRNNNAGLDFFCRYQNRTWLSRNQWISSILQRLRSLSNTLPVNWVSLSSWCGCALGRWEI